MISTSILPDGRLMITATGPERADCKAALAEDEKNGNSLEDYKREIEILQWLTDGDYETILPEHVGALTSAPMVCDDADNPAKVWAFMAYAVTSITAELAINGYAVFEFSEVDHKEAA